MSFSVGSYFNVSNILNELYGRVPLCWLQVWCSVKGQQSEREVTVMLPHLRERKVWLVVPTPKLIQVPWGVQIIYMTLATTASWQMNQCRGNWTCSPTLETRDKPTVTPYRTVRIIVWVAWVSQDHRGQVECWLHGNAALLDIAFTAFPTVESLKEMSRRV